MIVKNESRAILPALISLRPLITSWVIVDTGSSDGTQTLIQEQFKDIPGKLHEHPWRDFATNRNEAIALAKGMGDYLLFIDADDVVEYQPNFTLPTLDKDCYFCWRSSSGIDSLRPFLVKNSLEWCYEGAIHEALILPEERSYDTLTELRIVRNASSGARSRNPDTYRQDAALLEELLSKEPTNARYCFYLAQSYQAAGERQKAIEAYERRVGRGGDEEESYWALFQIASLKEAPEDVIEGYRRAYNYRKGRVEALYALAKCLREGGRYEEAFQVIKQAREMPLTEDSQFVARWMYEYGLLLEYAECAKSAGRVKEMKGAVEEALGRRLPFVVRMQFDKVLRKEGTKATQGTSGT